MSAVFGGVRNKLSMAQAVLVRGDHVKAITICRAAINSLKEVCHDTEAIQMIAMGLSTISEAFEAKNDLIRAVEYRRAQREMLEIIRSERDEDATIVSPSVRKRDVIERLDALDSLPLDPMNPRTTMERIQEAVDRAKDKKVREEMEAILRRNDARLKQPTWSEWFFSHSYKFVAIVMIVMAAIVAKLIIIATQHRIPKDTMRKQAKGIHGTDRYKKFVRGNGW